METESCCFVSNDCTKVYCTNCYRYRYENCNICNQIINETDFAMNFSGKYIHVQCMSCITCSKSLKIGQNGTWGLTKTPKRLFVKSNAEYYNIVRSKNLGLPNSTSQSAATGIETKQNGFFKAGLFILLSYCFGSKKQLYWQHVSFGNIQIHLWLFPLL